MSINNRVLCAVALALVLITASCGAPKYLVKGLTLPSGSTEVSYDKDIDMLNNIPIPMPGAGRIVHNVTVMFDCSNGWDSVAAHVDGCMQGAGYQNLSSQLGNIPGVGKAAEEMADMNNMMRTYNKMGGKFTVMLMNNNWMADSTGMSGMNMSSGDYTLMVMEYEGDD